MIWIWLFISIACILIELINKKCVYIWLAISGLMALMIVYINNNFILEFTVFLLGGFVLLVAFRQHTLNKLKICLSNRIINKTGILLTDVSKKSSGTAKIGIKKYQVLSTKNIKKGTKIKVVKVEGKHLFVIEDA